MKKYGNDYKKGTEGYEYTGKWYRPDMEPGQLRKRAMASLGCLVPAAVFFVAALSFENEAGRVFWILLPFVSMVFPLTYGGMGSYSLYTFCKKAEEGRLQRGDGGKTADSRVIVPRGHEGEMIRSEYEKGVRRPWRCGVALVCLSAAALAGEAAMIAVRYSSLKLGREFLFSLLCFLIFLCALAYTWNARKIMLLFTGSRKQ